MNLNRNKRIFPLPDLQLNVRVFIHGPKWHRLFDVHRRPVADVIPEFLNLHPRGKQLWWFDLESDVRELVCEPIRGDVYAMWSDPTERWGR
jgi:hypothetical protein